jgi:hypothetical protein
MKNEEELENPGLTFVNQLVNIDAEEPNEWARYGMPFVRRVFPQLMANKIVGVQPTKGPVGLKYTIKRIYNKADDDIVAAAWDSVPKFDEPPTQKTWVAPIPVKKNKQPYSLNPGKNYKRKNKW